MERLKKVTDFRIDYRKAEDIRSSNHHEDLIGAAIEKWKAAQVVEEEEDAED